MRHVCSKCATLAVIRFLAVTPFLCNLARRNMVRSLLMTVGTILRHICRNCAIFAANCYCSNTILPIETKLTGASSSRSRDAKSLPSVRSAAPLPPKALPPSNRRQRLAQRTSPFVRLVIFVVSISTEQPRFGRVFMKVLEIWTFWYAPKRLVILG